jgi:DNA primase
MIPILNNRGRVIAFGGRLLRQGEPKYLNSPETPLFHKGKQLFGSFNAKKHINKKRFIVCEGYMDAITLAQFGYPSVATLGTSVTEDQINKIWLFYLIISLKNERNFPGSSQYQKLLNYYF